MEEIAKSFRSLFEKISEFFDLFDLSFFVSGAIAAGAFLFWLYLAGINLLAGLKGWQEVLIIVLAFYVSGLACFAVGRWVRTGIFRRSYSSSEFDKHFLKVLRAHGLASHETLKEYLDRTVDRGIDRLYVRLWAEARQCLALKPSLSLINRYWVMAATYDGIAVALWFWMIVFIFWCLGWGLKGSLDWRVGGGAIAVLLLVSFACLREAGRYTKYQVEELVASIAVQRAKELE